MKRIISVLLVLLTVLSVLPISSFAYKPVAKSLDLPATNNNLKGDGFDWDNLEYVLKLDGLNLITTDDYGIKLPGGSTVILEGDNKITATRYGIQSFGSLTFTGSGTLTITVTDIGIRAMTSADRDNVIFREGKITVNAATGILSDGGKTVFSGAEVNVNSTVNSILANNVQFVGGRISLTSPVKAKGSVEINAVDLAADSGKADVPAITADKGFSLNEVKLECGTSQSALAKADGYNGESALKTVSTAKNVKYGMLFGGKLPAFVDYIVFALIIIAVAAVITVPIIIKKRKTDALIAKSKLNETKK